MKKNGFTLIELLVVMAIIGLLFSIILASLNSARMKSRDARRLADLNAIRLALSNFFDDNARYPTNAEGLSRLGSASAPNCNGQPCMPGVPKDPSDNVNYPYYQCSNALYHIGANLEDPNNPVLSHDFNAVPSICSASTIDSDDSDGCASEANRYCYDALP